MLQLKGGCKFIYIEFISVPSTWLTSSLIETTKTSIITIITVIFLHYCFNYTDSFKLPNL
jgi:hypothetical protein